MTSTATTAIAAAATTTAAACSRCHPHKARGQETASLTSPIEGKQIAPSQLAQCGRGWSESAQIESVELHTRTREVKSPTHRQKTFNPSWRFPALTIAP